MAIVLALILCFALAADLTAQSLPGRPALVVVEDDSDPARPFRQATAYTYDAEGRPLTIVEEQPGPLPGLTFVRGTAFRYDAQGRVASKTIDFRLDQVTIERETTDYAYDAAGRPTSEFCALEKVDSSGDLAFLQVVSTSYSYDAGGHLVEKLEMNDLFLDGTVDGIDRTIYPYESGLLIRELKGPHPPRLAAFVLETIITYDYDDQQRLIRQGIISTYPDGQPIRARKREIVYDEHGRPSRESWAFDSQLDGHPDSFSHTTRTYDANGDLIAESVSNSSGFDDHSYAFWYDSERRLIKKERTYFFGQGHAITTYFYEPPSQ
jgi:hypothetical protein